MGARVPVSRCDEGVTMVLVMALATSRHWVIKPSVSVKREGVRDTHHSTHSSRVAFARYQCQDWLQV